MSAGSRCRAEAARVLVAVAYQGKSLSAVLPDSQSRLDSDRDRSLLAALCYGAIRWFPRLDLILQAMLERPMKTADNDIRTLLVVGLYQLEYSRIPAHAAVSATVGATRQLGKPWAKGLANALLRRFQRERDELLARATADEAARWAHPQWWIDAVRKDWPEDWQRILEANNTEPPMWLRVSTERIATEKYLSRVRESLSWSADTNPWVDSAIRLDRPVGVEQLPGFAEGLVSVQDAGAQLAAGFLGASPGMKVLDACAAPGGKTAHLLQKAGGNLSVTAVDVSATRLARVAENLQRLGLKARLIEADVGCTEEWWDGESFDRILIDAPCTASGVIRRHPDIKLLRRADDVVAMTALQRRLISALWPLLRPGGRMLYCTCSIFRDENEKNISAFLDARPDARSQPLTARSGRPPWQVMGHGIQVLPGDADMDGFYYACLTTRGNSG
jgi:16S rRNA (cytosine967-C5)-methyltransferase